MIKNITYNGYTANPSDYDCPDGQLALAYNLINENGALRPILPPSELVTLPDGYTVVHIHQNSNFKHYIVKKGANMLYWFDSSVIDDATQLPISISVNAGNLTPLVSLVNIYMIKSIGNMLIAFTGNGIYYNLWKDGSYLPLGSHIPELDIKFSFLGSYYPEHDPTTAVTLKGTYPRNDSTKHLSISVPVNLTTEDQEAVTAPVLAVVNKAAADSAQNGAFLFPFFVRYAYRLTDGTTTMASAPILMRPSYYGCPLTPYTYMGDTYDIKQWTHAQYLSYVLPTPNQLSELIKWKDIVSGIAIFVSAPIYNYNQSGKCARFLPIDYYPELSFDQGSALLELPQFEQTVDDRAADVANFYLLKEYSLEDFNAEAVNQIKPADGYLSSLVTHESLTDDYQSHDSLIAKYAFNYNARINLANIQRRLFDGFNPIACNQQEVDANETVALAYTAYVHIKSDQGTSVVCADESDFSMPKTFFPRWFYYPDSNAFKVVIVGRYVQGYNDQSAELNKRFVYQIMLKKHNYLNGAYYLLSEMPEPIFTYAGGDEHLEDAVPESCRPLYAYNYRIELPNKIYTSEVNNPVTFPLSGINTVAANNIIGIAAANKALSEGQIGQFPLYVFTSDGVWALEVSSEGLYSAKQIITADACINENSITQIDSSVLFATDRGIMQLSGSNATCISDVLNANDIFNIVQLPAHDVIVDYFNSFASDKQKITLDDINIIPFADFLNNCRLVYDYTNQRIIVYNSDVKYAYVLSLKSKLWAMMHSDIANSINSYTEALAMSKNGTLINYSKPISTNVASILITRPLKLDAPDVHKTITDIIQRGHFQRGDLQTVLYGSRDLFTWHLVWSSKDHYLRGFRGTPYKYFRIVVLASLTDGKSISGASVNFEPRHTNRLR